MRFIVLSLGCLLISGQSQALDWALHGGIKNESAYFNQLDQRWDKIQNRIELKPEVVFENSWQFRSRFLAWYDAAMDVENTNAADLTDDIKEHYKTEAQTKEAYLFREGDNTDIRIGWQQIVWGKTDGLRMLDIINPLDMREFILDDFLDSRIGLFAARLNYYPETDIEQEIELVIIPDARAAEAAPAGARWAFATPPPPAGVTLQQLTTEEPEWGDVEAGLAWRANITGWDLSLNYFYGWKDSPNAFRRIDAGVMTLQLKHLRMHTVGGSFSNAFGPWVLRGELASNLREGINASGSTFADTVQRKTTLNSALALEWNKYNWSISPQLFIRHIVDWDNSLMEAEDSGFITLRVATDFMHEKLKPELLILTDWKEDGWLARPKVSYEYSDQFVYRLGADLFGGSDGFLGQFAANDRLYVELEYTF